jgi:hypothetical protein
MLHRTRQLGLSLSIIFIDPPPPSRSHRLVRTPGHAMEPPAAAAAAVAPAQDPSAERVCITTAINYANGAPHMGHAYEAISADVVARYHRAYGRQVREAALRPRMPPLL